MTGKELSDRSKQLCSCFQQPPVNIDHSWTGTRPATTEARNHRTTRPC